MKVLLIDVNCKHSSTGKIVYDLYTEMNNSGNEAAICYGRGPLIKEHNIFKFGLDMETLFHAGMTRLTGLTGYFSIISTLRLINYIERFGPDVVHIHELHAYFVNIGRLMSYLKKKNIKTVWTFHCEFMYTGKCGHAHDCEKWKKECHKCPQLRVYPKSLIFDFTHFMHLKKKHYFEGFNNLTIVTPSEWLANRVRLSFLNNKSVKVVYNGIDCDKVFYPRDTTQLKENLGITDQVVVLSVASSLMSQDKGGDLVIEIAKRLSNKNFRFIMIGVDKPDQINFENIIALSVIKDQMKLAEYYSLSDVTLLLSKKETFSLVAAESIACGTPILGFESGASKEVIGNNGILIEYGGIDEIVEILLDYQHSNLPRISNTSDAQKFTRNEMFNRYLSVYEGELK
ncbi:MAG TPA: glycosyltransferase [Erysipelotrichaceae bacterium]|nr:glycosyltransferase [Erysipelotrichaceae bacterium]